MENEKWLLVLICAASLIGGFATALKILDGVDFGKAPQPAARITAMHSKSGWSEADLGIEHYHFKH